MDLGKWPRRVPSPPPPLFWVKRQKLSQKEEKLAGQAKQNLPPLTHGLDLPLETVGVGKTEALEKGGAQRK